MSSYYDLAKAQRPLHEYQGCVPMKLFDGTMVLALVSFDPFKFEHLTNIPVDKAGSIAHEVSQIIAAARALVGVL